MTEENLYELCDFQNLLLLSKKAQVQKMIYSLLPILLERRRIKKKIRKYTCIYSFEQKQTGEISYELRLNTYWTYQEMVRKNKANKWENVSFLNIIFATIKTLEPCVSYTPERKVKSTRIGKAYTN